MKQKNILYISFDGAFEPIPQSQVIPYLIGLSKAGYIFHWLSFDKRDILGFENKKDKLKHYLLQHNIHWHSLNYYRRPYLAAKIFNIFCGIIVSFFFVLKNDISVIHCRSEVASIIGSCVKLILKKKLIYDRRGFMAEDYIEGGMWKSRDSFIYKMSLYADRKMLYGASWVVVLTRKMKDILITEYPGLNKKISVIPCCADLQKFKFDSEKKYLPQSDTEGKFTFLYSGSLGTWYMLDEMLAFFKVAQRKMQNTHFIIFTLGEQRLIDEAIEKNKLNRNDFTVRGIPPENIHEFIAFGKVGLIFIKPVFSKLASSPTKFAENLACGMPIIINAGIGDTEEIILKERVGVIVKSFDEKAYQIAIQELIDLLAEGHVLQQRCRDTALKYFSLEHGVQQYLGIYNRILN